MFAALLTPLVTRILVYVGIAVLLSGMAMGGYYAWKRAIVQEANQALIVRQLEQAISDVKKANEELEYLRGVKDSLVKQAIEAKKKYDEDIKVLEDQIDGAEDRPASDVLKNTVRGLGKR